MSRKTSRRGFLRHSAAVGVGFWAAGGVQAADSKSPNEKLSFACIGVGGKGNGDTDNVSQLGNIVALCDIDENRLNDKAKKFPDAKKFFDFRKMLDEMGKSIDAVTVSTPDHTHAPASIMAMKMGKHVYCQKPLTHSVYEARMMREVAKENKVCTQMGNQGTAEDGLRRAVEIIRDGVIGPVREVHVWTNRPTGFWKQAPDVTERPKQSPGIPNHVHWYEFLGPAPDRPYHPYYHPFAWRGWWDFGTGALGDMACHTANMAFMALKLGSPTTIHAESGPINPETYPAWATIHFEFPARNGMPPVKLTWYEGFRNGQKLLPPPELSKGKKLSSSGSLLVGDKGILFSPNDYGARYDLLPEKEFTDYKGPEQTLPRNGKGDLGMKMEWVEAIKAGKPSVALSNFEYAGTLTEAILLGNVAMRVGKKIEWDGPGMQATNCPEAAQYIKPEYRKGWTL